MEQLTKEQAIQFADNEIWRGMSNGEIALFQIDQEFLCMPWQVFHKAVSKALDRPVFTHEFANADRLRAELHFNI